jgi:N-acetylmuramoyl-L-alanine amidase
MKTRQLAAMVGCHAETLRRLARSGELQGAAHSHSMQESERVFFTPTPPSFRATIRVFFSANRNTVRSRKASGRIRPPPELASNLSLPYFQIVFGGILSSPILSVSALLLGFSSIGFTESVPGVRRIEIGQYKPGRQPASLAEYVHLTEVQAAFKLDVTADPVSGIHRVRGPKVNAVLCPGMTRFLFNGSFEEFEIPVVMMNGQVMVPTDFASLLQRQSPLPPVKVKRTPDVIVKRLGEKKFQARTIVLDAGHGGKDPGASGPTKLMEKKVALDVTLRLQNLLQLKGHKVFLTRSTDKYPTLEQRTELVQSIQPHLFLSIHANAAANSTVTGIETFFGEKPMSLNSGVAAGPHPGDLNERTDEKKNQPSKWTRDFIYQLYFNEFHSESQRLSYCIQNSLMAAIPTEKNRGVKQRRFFVVRWSQSPSALVELGFLSNPGTERKMKTAAYRKKLAEALYEGLMDYLY